ncbi:MAG: Protein kinase [Myxococcaceae bacterium]|nr:Protein kinase [Myxococcaceae bacterium]
MKSGDVLSDRYELVSSIGRGGMGEVFHAVHLETGANVAIKVVSRAFIGDLLMARLEREAAAAARIQSPFIPRMLEVDRTAEGELYLVMELLQGESLSERLKRNGGMLPWDEARLIGDHVLQALIAAHAAGVVHRDLKPGNIFIETMPAELGSDRQVPIRARILDFGVCKLDGLVEGEKLTVTGESVGTIAYMAPEQIRGASRVDERADLYSFAMVIFEMVSGRLAYDAAGQMALLASKLERHARPLSSCVQIPVPSALEAIINKALSREPGDRQPNAREVLHTWRSLGPATHNPVSLPIVTHSGITSNVGNPPTQTVLTAGAAPPNGGKASRSSLAVAVAAIVVSLLVGVSAMRHRPVADVGTTSADPREAPTDLVSPAIAATGDTIPTTVAQPQQLGPVIPADQPAEVYEIPGDRAGSVAKSGTRVHLRQPDRAPRKPATSGTNGPAIIEQPHY